MAPRPAKRARHSSSGPDLDDEAVVKQGDSALISAKRNFSYLVSPTGAKDHPSRFRTRALLRSFHYIGQFVFWRLIRWAKYIAVGSLVAAISATAFGGVISGVAWIAAPPTFGASIIAATVWWLGKKGARRLQHRWDKSKSTGGGGSEPLDPVNSPVRRDGTWRQETGPTAIPW